MEASSIFKVASTIHYAMFSDRKVSVSAETETEYSAEYSAETECSVIHLYLVSAEYSVHFANRNRNYNRTLNEG